MASQETRANPERPEFTNRIAELGRNTCSSSILSMATRLSAISWKQEAKMKRMGKAKRFVKML